MFKLKKLLLVCLFLSIASFNGFTQKNDRAWKKTGQILTQIENPSFPNKIICITDFGAVGDGVKFNTKAIKEAISVCSKAGGGVVLIPPGKYKTGAIHLQDNINLKLADGAELMFSTDPNDYLPIVETSWEGMSCYNYSPLIYAANKNNVAITGEGLLNGMASNTNWWTWKGFSNYGWKEGMPSQKNEDARALLECYNQDRVSVRKRIMGEGHYLRPQFIQFYKCKNVLIEGIRIVNSPFWVIHPIFSENVIIRDVTVNSQGPNNDGCDPESCKNVLIEGCTFDTGDDCIALKSGRNEDGREINIPIENVLIRNCHMANGHGGVVIGSEISGGVKNIFVENCTMDSPLLERAIRIKTNTHRGGIVENVYIRNIIIGEVEEAVIRINCKYNPEEGEGLYLPLVKNIYISGIQSKSSQYPLFLTGLKKSKSIKKIYIKNCAFQGVDQSSFVEAVHNLSLNNVTVNGTKISCATLTNGHYKN